MGSSVSTQPYATVEDALSDGKTTEEIATWMARRSCIAVNVFAQEDLATEIALYLHLTPQTGTNDTYLSLIGLCKATAPNAAALYRCLCPLPTPSLLASTPLRAWRGERLLWSLLVRLPQQSSVAVAGSFALHSYMRQQGLESTKTWAPTDVDVYVTETKPYSVVNKRAGKINGGNMAVFVRHILKFCKRVEDELGIPLRLKDLPESYGGKLTLQHMRNYIQWVDRSAAMSNDKIQVPPLTGPGSQIRLCMKQWEGGSFGLLPMMENYVRKREGGTSFFLVDVLLPPTLAKLGMKTLSFIGGRDWIMDVGLDKLEKTPSLRSQAAKEPTLCASNAYLRRILDDFDIDICKVGMQMNQQHSQDAREITLSFMIEDPVKVAVSKQEMQVVKEGHLKTPSRLKKYSNRGFTVHGKLGVALLEQSDDFLLDPSGDSTLIHGRRLAMETAIACDNENAVLREHLIRLMITKAPTLNIRDSASVEQCRQFHTYVGKQCATILALYEDDQDESTSRERKRKHTYYSQLKERVENRLNKLAEKVSKRLVRKEKERKAKELKIALNNDFRSN